MHGFTEADCIIIELFAGTGGVTAAFKRLGFQNSIAVDKVRQSGTLVNLITLDLTSHNDQQAVLQWIRHPAVAGVFLAPPCGTASAARAIHVPGENPPQPLRSLEQPDGSFKGAFWTLKFHSLCTCWM